MLNFPKNPVNCSQFSLEPGHRLLIQLYFVCPQGLIRLGPESFQRLCCHNFSNLRTSFYSSFSAHSLITIGLRFRFYRMSHDIH